MQLLVSVPRLHSVSVVSKPASTGSRETVGAEQTSPGRLAPVYRSYNIKEISFMDISFQTVDKVLGFLPRIFLY